MTATGSRWPGPSPRISRRRTVCRCQRRSAGKRICGRRTCCSGSSRLRSAPCRVHSPWPVSTGPTCSHGSGTALPRRANMTTSDLAMSDEVVLDLDGLRMHYGTIEVLRGVTFRVRRGDVLALLGPNGAGKTTTSSGASCHTCSNPCPRSKARPSSRRFSARVDQVRPASACVTSSPATRTRRRRVQAPRRPGSPPGGRPTTCRGSAA